MEDIIVWSFETHGIRRQVVVVYGKVYTYMLVIYGKNKKIYINIYIRNGYIINAIIPRHI